MKHDNPTEEEIHDYLDVLRDSGITNMLGASAFVRQEFKLDYNTARDHVKNWIQKHR